MLTPIITNEKIVTSILFYKKNGVNDAASILTLIVLIIIIIIIFIIKTLKP